MRFRKCFCLLLACITIIGCAAVSANAADIREQGVGSMGLRATGKFDLKFLQTRLWKQVVVSLWNTEKRLQLQHRILRPQLVWILD